jgi:hypothetical protein
MSSDVQSTLVRWAKKRSRIGFGQKNQRLELETIFQSQLYQLIRFVPLVVSGAKLLLKGLLTRQL